MELRVQVSKGLNAKEAANRRSYHRHVVECRARIVIGTRHYAGYLHNISRGGARLRTISPIGRIGRVLVRLPDLAPLRCRLQWSDSYNAGVAFDLVLSDDLIRGWLRSRSGTAFDCDIAQLDEAA